MLKLGHFFSTKPKTNDCHNQIRLTLQPAEVFLSLFFFFLFIDDAGLSLKDRKRMMLDQRITRFPVVRRSCLSNGTGSRTLSPSFRIVICRRAVAIVSFQLGEDSSGRFWGELEK